MTFDELEDSRELAAPLELYLFTTPAAVYAYCNGDDDFTFDGVTYTAVPIDRDRINSSGGLDRSTLTVRLADSTPLASVLRGYPVSAVISLVIRQGHALDQTSPFLVAWAGRVLSAKGTATGIRELTCQPASTSLKRTGLRRFWGYGCPHVLYGPQCRASQSAATLTTTPTSATGSTVIVPSGWNGSRAVEKFQGGLVIWGSEIRTVMRATATSLKLSGPASFAPGTVLSVTLGCDHTMNDCRTLHVPSDEADYGGGNIHNYGGQPFIPTTNPVGIYRNY